jgi:hypothetical protein
MTPSLSVDDSADLASANPELTSQRNACLPCEVTDKDLVDLIGRKPLPTERVASTLPLHVRVVIGVGSEEQVVRPAAQSVVAPMADAYPKRDGSVDQHPSHSVGTLRRNVR